MHGHRILILKQILKCITNYFSNPCNTILLKQITRQKYLKKNHIIFHQVIKQSIKLQRYMPCPSLHSITCSASKQILNSISIQYLLKSSAIISDTLHTYNVILLFYNLLFDQHVIMLKYIFFPFIYWTEISCGGRVIYHYYIKCVASR